MSTWYYAKARNKKDFIKQFMPIANRNTGKDFLYNPDYEDYEYICFNLELKSFFFRSLDDLLEYANDSEKLIYVDLTVKQMEVE